MVVIYLGPTVAIHVRVSSPTQPRPPPRRLTPPTVGGKIYFSGGGPVISTPSRYHGVEKSSRDKTGSGLRFCGFRVERFWCFGRRLACLRSMNLQEFEKTGSKGSPTAGKPPKTCTNPPGTRPLPAKAPHPLRRPWSATTWCKGSWRKKDRV